MKKRKSAGFTFVEILVGISIASVAALMLVGILSQNTQLFSDQNSKISQGLELNNAQPIIEETIKSGAGIVSQYPLTGQATYTTGAETIVLSTPSVNAQDAVINNTYDYIVLYRDALNQKIMRKKVLVDPASSRKPEDQVILTKLSSLEFRYLNASDQSVSPVQATKIGYIINISDLIATEENTSSVSGQINLRND